MPHSIFHCTSITIDEAVAILLGWFEGPVKYERVDGGDDGDEPIFDIREILREEEDVLVGDHAEAKFDKLPLSVIAEKHAALIKHRELIDQANAYLCIIHDEINKGDQSALRVDTDLSNAQYTFITIASFNEWAKQYDRAVLVELRKFTDATSPALQPKPNMSDGPKKPRIKMREQENAIVAQLNERGIDPASVPKNFSGYRGIKAEIKDALEKSSLFKGVTVFDKAWERVTNKKK